MLIFPSRPVHYTILKWTIRQSSKQQILTSMCETKGHFRVRENAQLPLFGFSTFCCDSLTINATLQTVISLHHYVRSLTQTLYSQTLNGPQNEFSRNCTVRELWAVNDSTTAV